MRGQIPFQITFRDFPESDSVWITVQNRIKKLEDNVRLMRGQIKYHLNSV